MNVCGQFDGHALSCNYEPGHDGPHSWDQQPAQGIGPKR